MVQVFATFEDAELAKQARQVLELTQLRLLNWDLSICETSNEAFCSTKYLE